MILEANGLPNYYITTPLFFNGFNRDGLILDFAVLFTLGLIYRVITLIILRFKRRNFSWIEWLLELRNWIFVPIVVIMGLFSGLVALMIDVNLAISAFQLGILSYLIYAFNVHYCCFVSFRKKTTLAVHPSLTLLQVNTCINNIVWIGFQFVGDSLIAIFSLLWILGDAGNQNGRAYVTILLAVGVFIKGLGFLVLLRQRSTDLVSSRSKVVSAYLYPILLFLSTISIVLLTFNLSANAKVYPALLCGLPLFALLLKAIWNSLIDLSSAIKLLAILPACVSYSLAILRIDFNIQISSFFVISPLIIYPTAYLGIISRTIFYTLYSFILFSIKGFTVECTTQILSLISR
jgi:hypothetical protein